nr:zinc-binding dehydrogenase [Kineococcus aurantiacus]
MHGRGDVRIEERPVPTPGSGEVLLRVTRAGICGTDAGEFTHGPSMFPVERAHPVTGHHGPMVIGHEFIGDAVAAGPGAEEFTGRRFASGAGVWCGQCPWCRAGRINLCERYWTAGLSADGGLAGFVTVPATTLVEIPDASHDDAMGLAQPLAVGLHAARRSGAGPGDVVVLVGAGAIGSFILCGLAGSGAERIIALDVDPHRLATAGELGATETHDVSDRDPVALVHELTDGVGASITIEATGRDGSAQRALDTTRRGGRVLFVGLPHAPQPLDLAPTILREVEMTTTLAHVCTQDLPEAVELLRDGRIADLLLGEVIGLDDLVTRGLQPLSAGTAPGKVLVDPWR